MCGRYVATTSADELADVFGAADFTGDDRLDPDYNVAPTDPVHIVRESRREGTPQRVISTARWGLVPSWADDPKIGARYINARAESLDEKPAFRTAYARRRCLVPADGWYEWMPRPNEPGKQPFFTTRQDGGVIAFAGLWEVWGSGEDRLITSSVVTVPAQGEYAEIHDRMPLLLPPAAWASWLGEHGEPADPEDIAKLLDPVPDVLADLEIRPVGPAVGDVRNDGPELIERLIR